MCRCTLWGGGAALTLLCLLSLMSHATGMVNRTVLFSAAVRYQASHAHSVIHCFFLPSSNTLLADTQSLRVTVQRNYLGISDRIAEMKISHPINL